MDIDFVISRVLLLEDNKSKDPAAEQAEIHQQKAQRQQDAAAEEAKQQDIHDTNKKIVAAIGAFRKGEPPHPSHIEELHGKIKEHDLEGPHVVEFGRLTNKKINTGTTDKIHDLIKRVNVEFHEKGLKLHRLEAGQFLDAIEHYQLEGPHVDAFKNFAKSYVRHSVLGNTDTKRRISYTVGKSPEDAQSRKKRVSFVPISGGHYTSAEDSHEGLINITTNLHIPEEGGEDFKRSGGGGLADPGGVLHPSKFLVSDLGDGKDPNLGHIRFFTTAIKTRFPELHGMTKAAEEEKSRTSDEVLTDQQRRDRIAWKMNYREELSNKISDALAFYKVNGKTLRQHKAELAPDQEHIYIKHVGKVLDKVQQEWRKTHGEIRKSEWVEHPDTGELTLRRVWRPKVNRQEAPEATYDDIPLRHIHAGVTIPTAHHRWDFARAASELHKPFKESEPLYPQLSKRLADIHGFIHSDTPTHHVSEDDANFIREGVLKSFQSANRRLGSLAPASRQRFLGSITKHKDTFASILRPILGERHSLDKLLPSPEGNKVELLPSEKEVSTEKKDTPELGTSNAVTNLPSVKQNVIDDLVARASQKSATFVRPTSSIGFVPRRAFTGQSTPIKYKAPKRKIRKTK